MNYKVRKLKSILLSITYERNNLVNLYSHEIPSNKELNLTRSEKQSINTAIKNISAGMLELEKIKGILK